MEPYPVLDTGWIRLYSLSIVFCLKVWFAASLGAVRTQNAKFPITPYCGRFNSICYFAAVARPNLRHFTSSVRIAQRIGRHQEFGLVAVGSIQLQVP